jgi:hypothetical protein
MAQEDDGGVGAAARQANGPEAHPIAQNVAGADVPVNGVVPGPAPGVAQQNLVVGVPPRFDVDAVLLGPLPTRSNFMGYEIHPWLDEEEP